MCQVDKKQTKKLAIELSFQIHFVLLVIGLIILLLLGASIPYVQLELNVWVIVLSFQILYTFLIMCAFKEKKNTVFQVRVLFFKK